MGTASDALPRHASNLQQSEGLRVWNKNKLTLRDYFAAQAMSGAMSGMHVESIPNLAKFSYKVADAMLEARESSLTDKPTHKQPNKGNQS